MADAFVSAILQQLTAVLYEETRHQVKLVTGVGKEIKKLQRNLESIRVLLDDAERRQITEGSIKLWLDRLKEVCYDMEDVLDEWSTALLKSSQIDDGLSKGKVCCPLIPCFGKVVHRRDIAVRIKEINETLDDIAKEKDSYQLASSYTDRDSRRVVESTSFVDVSQLHGRDKVKGELISSLFCGSSDEINSQIKTISVVGIGGMGKTTLAQLIYNDGDVQTQFDKRIWICVSEGFDIFGVAKSILRCLHPESLQSSDSFTLQDLFERIYHSIEGKKIFLVLDDVWMDESKNWESLRQAMRPAACESRILATTRNVRVARALKSFHVLHLGELNADVCWKILSQEAFVEKGERQRKNLETVGRRIAEKCSGSPLIAKTLGGMLRYKETKEEWQSIFNSAIWELDMVQKDVFAPLLLSYYDLPPGVRRCFLYCSVFPKNHVFNIHQLIYEWMAQGYLRSCSENSEMEVIGGEYFDCLVARSFFQDFSKGEDGSIYECKMHDMVVDFARFLMGNEVMLKELEKSEEDNSSSRLAKITSSRETRHLLITGWAETCLPPKMLFNARLRSLAILDGSCTDEAGRELSNLCIQPKRLRSLNFRRGCVVNEFPKEVGNLMHLRLLNLSGCSLKMLPESICELYNLQTLLLRGCSGLRELPKQIEKLINLRCLDITLSSGIAYYPKGIGRLSSLRELRGIVVRVDCNDDEKFSLRDLENLCKLRHLMLVIHEDRIDANEARQAKLESKMHLKTFQLALRSLHLDDVVKVLKLPSHTHVSSFDEVEERANNFIRVFREQLRLHRLDDMIRYKSLLGNSANACESNK